VIDNAKGVGLSHLIVTGTNLGESESALQLARRFDNAKGVGLR